MKITPSAAVTCLGCVSQKYFFLTMCCCSGDLLRAVNEPSRSFKVPY